MAKPIISVDDVVVGEGDGFAEFVVRLNAPGSSTVTVSYSTTGETAGTGTDFEAVSGTLTFAAGETVKTVRVPIIDDTTAEPKEDFLFNLSGAANAVIGNSSAMATIIDNDAASGTPVISIGDRVVDEAAGLVNFTVTLDRPSTGTVTANYATAAGTAGAADFTAVSGTLAFAPGETAKTISVPITNDTLAEGDEKFDLVLSSPVGATLPDPRGTAVIAASDQTAVATPVISVGDVVVGEGDGFAEFVVRLNAPSNNGMVTVSYSTTGETAGTGTDFEAVSGTLTFAAGETVKTVRVPIIDDTTAEPKEDFLFNLSGAANAVIGNSSAMATIIDNDAASGTPVISIGDRVVDEAAGLVNFTVTLDRPSTGTVTANYATAAGTAGAADFTAVSGTLAFAPGETAKTISVPITNDTLAEGDEKFDLVLSSPVGATLPDPRGTAVIAASDQTAVATPVISVGDVVVGEGDGFAEFVVRLNAPSNNGMVTVSYSTTGETAGTGTDFEAVSGTLTFAAGETVKTVRVPIIDDTTAEPKEDFLFNLSGAANAVIGNSSAMATIIDNDAASGTPVISIGDRVVDEAAGLVNFTVTLDRPSTGTVTANYATAAGTAGAADFTAVSGTLAFAPGETAKTISVPITNDTLAEGDEKFDLVLSSPVGATLPDPRGTAVIAASDQTAVATPVISVGDVVVGEGDGFAEFVVRLNAPGSSTVTVSYSTTGETAGTGTDFEAVSGTLTFAAGETVKTVRVPIIDDTTAEPKEDFLFNLSGAANAVIGNSSAMATILDDDTAPVLGYGNSNDTYVVTHPGTRIIEAPNGGTDRVLSNVTYTLDANVENLTLTGTSPINGTGNAANNIVTGNAGDNVLNGAGGVDTVSYASATAPVTVSLATTTPQNTGGGGTDTLSGFENLTGSNFSDHLTGTSGANIIDGGKGADVMSGGGGNDTYLVDTPGDVVTETAGGGTDTVLASVSYTLAAGTQIEFLRANAGATGLSLTGNALVNTVVGGPGNDTLTGAGGADTLTGGAGADTFTYRALSDSTVAAAGRDTITDFSSAAGDKIDLHLIDAVSTVAGDQAFNFIGTNPFSGKAGELDYVASGGNTTILGDVNGDKVADFSILLNGSHVLAASDFTL